MIPPASHERLVAEASAFPLWHFSTLQGATVALTRDGPGVFDRAAEACVEHLRLHANGASIPQLQNILACAWFSEGETRVTLAQHVVRLATEHLELRGPRVGLRQDDGKLAHVATCWRWLSLVLPGDLLIAALAAERRVEPRTEHVELVTAHLARTLQAPCAETHLHVGAGISFGVLWTGLMRRVVDDLDTADAIKSRFGESTPGANPDLYLRLLRASSLARLACAAFLIRDGGARGERFEIFLARWLRQLADRLPWSRGPDDLHRALHGVLVTLCAPTRAFSPQHRRDRELLALVCGPMLASQNDPAGALAEGDPLASRLSAKGHTALPETRLAALALGYMLREGRGDEGFAKVFWQYQRVRGATFRLLTQEPGTAGLDWFTRFYNRIGFFRETLPKHYGQEPSWFYALDTQSRHLRLGALEARTRPDEAPGDIRELARGIARQALAHARSEPDRGPPEVGVVLHFIKAATHTVRKQRRAHGDPGNFAYGARHAVWFEEQRRRALAVARALDHHPELLLVLRGVDAANLEQVQPTWVLRPLFDLMRAASEGASRRLELARPAWRALPFRATLHAGEDFLRVFEGVRRMHEAIEFGVLRQGDRFGHGLAVGVDPTTEAGTVVAQSREERLDDLLWELDRYALGDLSTTARVERVRHEARELAVTIYRADAASDLEIVRESRRMRHDPALLVDRWRYPLVDLSLTPGRFSEGLFVRYLTDRDVYARGQVMVAVRSTADERVMLAEAQRWLRRELARREVTIESNPSSNLLIGDLRSLDEHPAMRLQPIRPGESRDDAVLLSVNTDNPVTFASCLADEFAHLYTALLGLGVPSSDALAWIDRRREDGWRSRFTLEASALPGALERVLAPELNRAP